MTLHHCHLRLQRLVATYLFSGHCGSVRIGFYCYLIRISERSSFTSPLPSFSSVCLFNFREKTKQLQSGQTQHTKGTRDIITWQGNECPNPRSTCRSDYPTTSRDVKNLNESKPIHVRSNHGLRSRQLRAVSAPPSQLRAAPLLVWNEPDESQHGKPGVGLRQPIRNQRPNFTPETPFVHTTPTAMKSQNALTENFTVSETIVPLNAT